MSHCSRCSYELSDPSVRCSRCQTLTPYGEQRKATVLEHLVELIHLFDKEVGEQRNAMTEATTKFFSDVHTLSGEAKELDLEEVQAELERLVRKQNWDFVDLPDLMAVNRVTYPYLGSYQARLIEAATMHVELVAHRLMKPSADRTERTPPTIDGPEVEDLRMEFYERAQSQLERINRLFERPDPPAPSEVAKAHSTIERLKWEADTLEVPGPLQLRFWNMCAGNLSEIDKALRWIEIIARKSPERREQLAAALKDNAQASQE